MRQRVIEQYAADPTSPARLGRIARALDHHTDFADTATGALDEHPNAIQHCDIPTKYSALLVGPRGFRYVSRDGFHEEVTMRLRRIIAAAVVGLVSPLSVAMDEIEVQRCLWRCLSDASGPSDPAYHACAKTNCADPSALSQENATPTQSWRTEAEPYFTHYPTAFVDGETGSRIGMLGLFCADDVARVYVADIPGEAQLPLSARIAIDNHVFNVRLDRKVGWALSARASTELLQALMAGRVARVWAQGTEARFSLSGSHRAVSTALASCLR